MLEEFLNVLKKDYKSDAITVDFSAQEAARDTVNKFVKDHTNGLIKELMPPGSIDALTRLVLINTVYFKGLLSS